MINLLIIQTGDAVSSARTHGNFNDWFADAAGCTATTINVHKGQALPQIEQTITQHSHLIITGSAAMITERKDWMLSSMKWLEQVVLQVPTLGVCFGHQMLTDLLGGTVQYNPKGRNMGLDHCHLTDAGLNHPLFQDMKHPTFPTWVSHLQSVTTPPKGSVLLASSEKDPNHAYQFGDHCFALQFHPEWTGPIMAAYLEARSEDLTKEGFDVPLMLAQTAQNLATQKIIQRFIQT